MGVMTTKIGAIAAKMGGDKGHQASHDSLGTAKLQYAMHGRLSFFSLKLWEISAAMSVAGPLMVDSLTGK